MKTPSKTTRIAGLLVLGCIAAWMIFSKTSRWASWSERSVCQHCGLEKHVFRRSVNSVPYRITTSFETNSFAISYGNPESCDHRWIRIGFNSHLYGSSFARGSVAGQFEIRLFLDNPLQQAGMRSFATRRNLPLADVWSNFLTYYSQELGTKLIRGDDWFPRGEESPEKSFSTWLDQHYDLMSKIPPTPAHR